MSHRMAGTIEHQEASITVDSIETIEIEPSSATPEEEQEQPEFTPFAWRMTVLSLALGGLTLISIAAWVFAGIFRYQNMP